MSSLMQFDGKIGKRGVCLEFVHRDDNIAPFNSDNSLNWELQELEPSVLCDICGKTHEQIYTAWRKPCGMFGCWVVFRYNGKENVPDLSVLISVVKIPLGARKLSTKENAQAWHKS
jgi:hypothetical protein